MKKSIRQKTKLLDKEQIKKMLCDSLQKANRINEQYNTISDRHNDQRKST